MVITTILQCHEHSSGYLRLKKDNTRKYKRRLCLLLWEWCCVILAMTFLKYLVYLVNQHMSNNPPKATSTKSTFMSVQVCSEWCNFKKAQDNRVWRQVMSLLFLKGYYHQFTVLILIKQILKVLHLFTSTLPYFPPAVKALSWGFVPFGISVIL